MTQRATDLRKQVMRLHRRGKSLNQIARVVDRTPQRVHQIVKSEREKAGAK